MAKVKVREEKIIVYTVVWGDFAMTALLALAWHKLSLNIDFQCYHTPLTALQKICYGVS